MSTAGFKATGTSQMANTQKNREHRYCQAPETPSLVPELGKLNASDALALRPTLASYSTLNETSMRCLQRFPTGQKVKCWIALTGSWTCFKTCIATVQKSHSAFVEDLCRQNKPCRRADGEVRLARERPTYWMPLTWSDAVAASDPLIGFPKLLPLIEIRACLCICRLNVSLHMLSLR